MILVIVCIALCVSHNPRALTLDTYDTKAEHQVAIDLPTRSHLVAGRYEICDFLEIKILFHSKNSKMDSKMF